MEENEKIFFKYKFRDYQKRAFEEIDKYIDDNKIHIVAAPGAGKTILALNLVFKFNENTMVLVPTIAIREQWVERMINDFNNLDKNTISTDLKDIKKYNIITYQALYGYTKEEIKKIISKNKIKIVVMDEAHHLRNAWWKILTETFDEIKDIKTIALTATPPYDDQKNFEKYINLCGEIDTEVPIPELVKQKNLCPHQDYIYFNYPTKEQEKEINNYRLSSLKLINYIERNNNFLKAIATHRFIIDYKNNVDEIIENYDIFITMIKILKKNNVFIDREIRKIKKNYIITIKEYENLLKYLLYSKDYEFKIIDNFLKSVKNNLLEIGAIEDKNINLLYNKKIENEISQNIKKLESINDIINFEYKCLENKLKMVVVTDFIKEDTLDEDINSDNQIGAIPIFKSIRNNTNKNIKLIVLTGTTVIIPTESLNSFKEICYQNKLKEEDISSKEIGIDFEYCKVKIKKDSLMVKIITELFEKENISILVGTVALIGEGWDAPYVNTLIIASGISTYVTSNQLRGRAIRTDKKNPNKISNIWHIACLEKVGKKYIKGKDCEKIEKRFNHIEGLCLLEDKLKSGFDRFNLNKNSFAENEIIEQNILMKTEAEKREKIKKRWEIALNDYIPVNKYIIKNNDILKSSRIIHKANGEKYLFMSLIDMMAVCNIVSHPQLMPIGVILGLLNIPILTNGFNKRSYNKKALKNIAKAICSALKKKKLLDEKAYIKLENKNENYEIFLVNADTRSQNLFKKMLYESISKKITTRYLLIAGKYIFNIPSMFDTNKETAQDFLEIYKKENRVFKVKVIFSKTGKGKIEKLKIMMEQDEINEERAIFDSNVDIKWLSASLGIDNDLKIE